MKTDGGVIIVNGVKRGTQNHSREVKTDDTLTAGALVVSVAPDKVKTIGAGITGIVYTDRTGNVQILPVPPGIAGHNKLLATGNKNQLVWVDR